MKTEPVRIISWLVAIVTAASAAVEAYIHGMPVFAAIGAGLALLQGAGGELARSKVTPVDRVATYITAALPAGQAAAEAALERMVAAIESAVTQAAAQAQQASMAVTQPAPVQAQAVTNG